LVVSAVGVEELLSQFVPLFARGDPVIDGGTTYCRDNLRRAAALRAAGIHHLDLGTCGGVARRDRG
jgi:6-phosphogluconate dehydrogenase